MGLSPCLKFVIGGTLTILSWDNPVTAYFRKSRKLRHSLGRPSRSDFVQFQFCEKRIVSNPKGINRKKLVPFILLINDQRGCKIKLNMTGEVKYESRCDWTFFKKSDKVSALIF